ncbi:ubiquitin-like-specific protease 1A, partial [Olea europaea subsp. europaea]
VSCTIGQRTVSDPYKWFHDITTAGAWLADDHIDLAMDLLRDRAQRHPKSFDVHGRVILNIEFLRVVTIEYQSLELMGNEYTVPEYMLEWVIGLSPSVEGKSWEGCTHMYIPVCINKHYVTLEIVFADSTIYVYDPDHSCLTQCQLEQNLESMAVIVPMMARRAGINVHDRLRIVRNTTTARQSV